MVGADRAPRCPQHSLQSLKYEPYDPPASAASWLKKSIEKKAMASFTAIFIFD